MDSDDIVDVLLLLCATGNAYKNLLRVCQKRKKTRRFWTREIYTVQEREVHGYFNSLFNIIKQRDKVEFFKATRMDPNQFDILANAVGERLRKNSQRKPISAECRLALTLVYLAHGASRQTLAWTFRMGVCTVGRIVLETCEILWEVLSSRYVAFPNENNWKDYAPKIFSICGLPNCVGAIDGKHINITCPPNAGSEYFKNKGHRSIVLLAACDDTYCFTAVDIGAFGSQSDGSTFSEKNFGKNILNNDSFLPSDERLPDSNIDFPYYFVADAAFPLKRHIMRPYPGRLLEEDKQIFNTKLSRAHCLIENTFGILTARWRVLQNTIIVHPKNADKIVKGLVVLHNFLRENCQNYCPAEYVDQYDQNGGVIEGQWRQGVTTLVQARQTQGLNASREAFALRDKLKEYLCTTHNITN